MSSTPRNPLDSPEASWSLRRRVLAYVSAPAALLIGVIAVLPMALSYR